MTVEDRVEQIDPIAVFGVDRFKPIDELATGIPDRGGDEVEQVLAFVVDRFEGAIIGQRGDIDAFGELIAFAFEPCQLGLTGGNLGGDARLLAVGARRAVFVGAGLG
jgi:hypothetical protein